MMLSCLLVILDLKSIPVALEGANYSDLHTTPDLAYQEHVNTTFY
jgi:hypothetical protein